LNNATTGLVSGDSGQQHDHSNGWHGNITTVVISGVIFKMTTTEVLSRVIFKVT